MLFRQSNNTKYISIILKLSRERVSQPDPAELNGCTMLFRQSNNPKHFLEHFKALGVPNQICPADLECCIIIFGQSNSPKHFREHYKRAGIFNRKLPSRARSQRFA